MFCLDSNGDFNINPKATMSQCLLTLNLCRHILVLIVCFHGHKVFQKLSQGEQERASLILNLNILP